MLPAHLEQALTGLEHHFSEVSAALLSDEPQALVAASSALRQAALDFADLLQCLTPHERQHPGLHDRLKHLTHGLASRRESLIRCSAMVERALGALVPATHAATYAPAAGPYGSPGRQTGAFKYLAA